MRITIAVCNRKPSFYCICKRKGILMAITGALVWFMSSTLGAIEIIVAVLFTSLYLLCIRPCLRSSSPTAPATPGSINRTGLIPSPTAQTVTAAGGVLFIGIPILHRSQTVRIALLLAITILHQRSPMNPWYSILYYYLTVILHFANTPFWAYA